MKGNPIVAWYKKDDRLAILLEQIDKEAKSDFDAAKMAFYKVSDLYNLPKFPSKIDNQLETDSQNRSVYEEYCLVRLIFPKDELRGVVMMALFNIYHKRLLSYDHVAYSHFSDEKILTKNCLFYFFGRDVDGYVKIAPEAKKVTLNKVTLIRKLRGEEK